MKKVQKANFLNILAHCQDHFNCYKISSIFQLFHWLCLILINQLIITNFDSLSRFAITIFAHLSSLFFILIEFIRFLSFDLFFLGNHSKVSNLHTFLMLFKVFHLFFYCPYRILIPNLLIIYFLFLVCLFLLKVLVLYFLKTLIEILNRLDFNFTNFLFIFHIINSSY